MTKGNKLTRPWGGPQTRSQITVGPIPTNFSWNLNLENNEWEVVKSMPEGTDDVVEFSSPSKAAADTALRRLIERDYPVCLRSMVESTANMKVLPFLMDESDTRGTPG
jgi:hypothetical protein